MENMKRHISLKSSIRRTHFYDIGKDEIRAQGIYFFSLVRDIFSKVVIPSNHQRENKLFFQYYKAILWTIKRWQLNKIKYVLNISFLSIRHKGGGQAK
jgi:hypothetical protein